MVDDRRLSLDPGVLVIPVHVRVLRSESGAVPGGAPTSALNEAVARAWFDDAPAVELRRETWDDPIAMRVYAEAEVGLLPERRQHPDLIWTQCNIQFRVESYADLDQDKGLEEVLIDDSEGECRPSDRVCHTDTRLWSIHEDELMAHPGGLFVYFGGEIECSEGFGSVTAIACTTDCGSTVGASFRYVLVDFGALRALSADRQQSVLAHELGHVLSLGHEDGSAVSCDPANLAPPNLMRGAGPPTLPDARLTGAQCEAARAAAMAYLAEWGP